MSKKRYNKKKQFAIYCDIGAAPWQGMCVGHQYEILDIDTNKGGVPWYKTYRGKRDKGKTRWTSSSCFDVSLPQLNEGGHYE